MTFSPWRLTSTDTHIDAQLCPKPKLARA